MRALAFTCAFVGATACSKAPDQQGAPERFRVRAADDVSPAAQFIEGKLPGNPPKKGQVGNQKSATDAGPTVDAGIGPPEVVDHSGPGIVYPGQGSVSLKGSATPNSAAVGIALEGISTGYWVLPVGALEPQGPGKPDLRPWGAVLDFDASIPSGYRNVLEVAFDENNAPGDQAANFICFASRVPDNLNSCVRDGRPQGQPPNAVVSLTWDTNVDLDLQVELPNGRLISAKDPVITSPLLPDGGKRPPTAKLDQIDRDSNAGCVADGIRMENLVWNDTTPHGIYTIYANLFDACKQPSVRFRVEIYLAVPLGDGGSRLQKFFPAQSDPPGGELLEIDANAGTARGLFVTQFNFP